MKTIFEADDLVTLARTEIGAEDKIGKPFKFLSYLNPLVPLKVKNKRILFDCVIVSEEDHEISIAKSANLTLLKKDGAENERTKI